MISAIIPTLNEETCIGRCIESVRSAGNDCEIIVTDGGSSDRTRAVAESYSGVRVVLSKPGRGNQMNRGASHAQGDLLLFLHADTVLEEGWYDDIAAALRNGEIIGGAFTPSAIKAVSATSMRAGIVLYNAEGKELWGCANVDARAANEVRQLKEQFPGLEEKFYRISGRLSLLAPYPVFSG